MSARRARALVVGALSALPVAASDHIDGPLTTSHRAGDLTDLYAFPTPERAGSLTVILDAYPLAPADARFSADVGYTIRLRRASLPEPGAAQRIETGSEVAIDCTFRALALSGEAVVTCRSSNGLRARSRVDTVSEGGDFRLWAGMRTDPFFLDVGFFSDALDGRLGPPDGDDGMRGANVLALVLELELGELWPDPPSFVAVAAHATARDPRGISVRRLDRIGRPEITNVGLAARDEPDMRDISNLDRPFQVAAERLRHYRERLERNVAFFDALDGTTDWGERERAALAAVLADDFLVVDLARPCTPGAFLEIETSLLGRHPHRTCGGRRLEDDVIDTLFTLYVSGWSGRRVRDGVDRPAAAVSGEFPYLAPPATGFRDVLRVWAARKVLEIPDAP
jgi:hypothetical protein